MNLSVALCGILLVVLTISACSGDTSNSYSITIEHLLPEQTEPDSEGSIDYSSAIVSIKRIDIGETDEEVLSELMSSPFRNGKVKLRGHIEQPTWVEVVVDSDNSEDTLSTRTLVEPGENVSLAVVEDKDLFSEDTIAHIGSLSNVQDPSKKISLVGDFNSSSVDFLNAIAYLQTTFWNEKGQDDWELHSFIVLQEGKFIIEMELDAPMFLSLYVSGTPSYSSYATFIADPGTTILFQPSKHSVHSPANLSTGWFQGRQDASQNPQNQLSVHITGSERHARFFDSWQKSFTYRLKEKQFLDADEEFNILSAEQAELRPIVENSDEIQHEDSESSRTKASWVKTALAEGCEHVSLSQVRPERRDFPTDPLLSRMFELSNEMSSIRIAAKNDIARRAKDPFDALLALEFGALRSPQQLPEAIKIFDYLSQLFSEDIVDRRITPARNYLSSVLESQKQDHRTVPGQKVPDFELPDVHGNLQRFSNILEENALVFMSFNKWGEHYSITNLVTSLHDTYGEAGLQIVEVLFDVNSDLQQELALNQDIAWIQLLDPNIYSESEIATSYAIVHKYVDFLVDTHGCIVQRNIPLEDLRNYLDSYFDIPASTE